MARFAAYNTEDAAAERMGYAAVGSKGEVILQSLETGKAETVTGSIWTEKKGTLYVEQSFDGEAHWDISESKAITAETGTSFEVKVVAPIARVRFVNGESAECKKFRLFARTDWQQGK